MERKISLSELRSAVDEAYEQYKSMREGEVDARMEGVDADVLGIAVMLTDGTVIKKGNTDIAAPLGSIAKVPIAVLLNTQYTPEKLMEKAGFACGKCSAKKPDVPVSSRGVRAVSMIEPFNDPDGKWDLIINNMIDLMGSSPVLNDNVYKSMKKEMADANVEDTLTKDGFYLYDNASIAIDQYVRAMSMSATAEQLAQMGATIAADGRNPLTGENVFDGTISQRVVAMMATHGPHKMTTPWMMMAGLPAKTSFGGLMMGVLPGVGAFAAYSPRLNQAGISVKAAMSLKYIMQKLQLSVYASAKTEIVK